MGDMNGAVSGDLLFHGPDAPAGDGGAGGAPASPTSRSRRLSQPGDAGAAYCETLGARARSPSSMSTTGRSRKVAPRWAKRRLQRRGPRGGSLSLEEAVKWALGGGHEPQRVEDEEVRG
jgi:hypothetical protein